jgi:cell division protein ZapA
MKKSENSDSITVTITLQGREYQVGCSVEQEEGLRKAARELDKELASLKSKGGSTLGFERLLVLTALNATYDLMNERQSQELAQTSALRELQQLEQKLDAVLHASKQIEI